jgi:hypothetical protein
LAAQLIAASIQAAAQGLLVMTPCKMTRTVGFVTFWLYVDLLACVLMVDAPLVPDIPTQRR